MYIAIRRVRTVALLRSQKFQILLESDCEGLKDAALPHNRRVLNQLEQRGKESIFRFARESKEVRQVVTVFDTVQKSRIRFV